jgi:hypothetical protein
MDVGDWVVRKKEYMGEDWWWEYGDKPFEIETSVSVYIKLVGLPETRVKHTFNLADEPNSSLSDYL